MLLMLVLKQLYEVVALIKKKKTNCWAGGGHELVTSCHPKITVTFIGVLQMQMVNVV